MKKTFFCFFLLISLFSHLFARGFEIDYFSPNGFTLGTNHGEDVFSLGYGLWVDTHEFKYRESDRYGYSSDTSKFIGPYIQLDWAILPFDLNVGGHNIKFGGNIGLQYGILYTSSDLKSHVEISYAPMISLQARYEAFDVTLGWKGTHYMIEEFAEDWDGDSHNSFQLGIRYTIGKRGWRVKSKSDSNSNEIISGRTRILNGSRSQIRRF
ncbi:MAG: hypothetical protein IJ207_04665 [Treponema sp.]|uniref:hypothetical protein n=1 Tax=Treponema sp. TaxID=166 RepID=UPI0025E35263|nr:hypothetical protein [Treponema sp.]MBQ9281474.1 hypothetical protein [Treponema sp.]